MCGNRDAQSSGRNEPQALLNLEELEEKLDLKDKVVKMEDTGSQGYELNKKEMHTPQQFENVINSLNLFCYFSYSL